MQLKREVVLQPGFLKELVTWQTKAIRVIHNSHYNIPTLRASSKSSAILPWHNLAEFYKIQFLQQHKCKRGHCSSRVLGLLAPRRQATNPAELLWAIHPFGCLYHFQSYRNEFDDPCESSLNKTFKKILFRWNFWIFPVHLLALYTLSHLIYLIWLVPAPWCLFLGWAVLGMSPSLVPLGSPSCT
jgi:hypothetical protein